MLYIDTDTLLQYTEQGIRGLFPNTSFPEPFIPPEGYACVFPTPVPDHNPIIHRGQETTPELTELGHWEQRWEIVSLFTEYTDENDVVHTVESQWTQALVADLEARRSTARDAIKAERDRRKFNGVFVSGKWIHTDTYSRTQWMGMVMMGAGIPAIPWTTMDNTSTTTSQALAGAVFQATATLDATLFAYAKSLIDQVDASSEPQNIDIMTGWPTTFGEAP